MCYLPVKCLKAIIFIGSICAIAISVGLLALTIFVQVSKKQIINAASQGAVTASFIAMYASSLLFLILGIAGLSGSMKGMSKKNIKKGGCLLSLFSIGIIIFFLVFLGATIFFFVGPSAIFGTDCTQGSKTTLIADLYSTSVEAYNKFCKSDCPCKLTSKTSDLYTEIFTKGGAIDDAGVQKFGDCPNLASSSVNIEILAALESIIGCGGWCPVNQDEPPFGTYTYRFRNINDCSDNKCLSSLENCHDALRNFMTGSGKIVGLGCLGATLVCFLNIIAVCCLCFHPSKRKNESNFYSHMMETD